MFNSVRPAAKYEPAFNVYVVLQGVIQVHSYYNPVVYGYSIVQYSCLFIVLRTH